MLGECLRVVYYFPIYETICVRLVDYTLLLRPFSSNSRCNCRPLLSLRGSDACLSPTIGVYIVCLPIKYNASALFFMFAQSFILMLPRWWWWDGRRQRKGSHSVLSAMMEGKQNRERRAEKNEYVNMEVCMRSKEAYWVYWKSMEAQKLLLCKELADR